jgi:carboxylate-amine ligase
MPSNLIEVLGLTALIQCLVVDLSQGGGEPVNDECDLMIIRQNRWRATRYGLEATLIDHRSGVKAPARETIQNMIDRLGDVAAAVGCSQYLAQAREMTKVASGAERQLADFDRTGDLLDVARRQLNGFGTPPPLNGPAPSLVSACEARCDPWLRLVTR